MGTLKLNHGIETSCPGWCNLRHGDPFPPPLWAVWWILWLVMVIFLPLLPPQQCTYLCWLGNFLEKDVSIKPWAYVPCFKSTLAERLWNYCNTDHCPAINREISCIWELELYLSGRVLVNHRKGLVPIPSERQSVSGVREVFWGGVQLLWTFAEVRSKCWEKT